MGTVIVGAGLAGLAAAAKLRLGTTEEVVLLERSAPISNTQVADQRYRAGIAGTRQDSVKEIEQLLASRNDGILTDRMQQLARLAEQELRFWQQRPDFLHAEDRREWFGPLLGTPNKTGKGWGRSVLQSFRDLARTLGVTCVEGQAQQLLLNGERMAGLRVRDRDGYYDISADRYVLANGSIGGRLFRDTTNVRITGSAHELAFAAGLTLTDSTMHMVHPFGRAGSDGSSHRGCFPVDELVEASVYVDGKLDQEVTELLRTYQAREHFPAIARHFRRSGGVVELRFPDGESLSARVAHHSGHIGIETTDGITVRGAENLYAVGDASTIAYWTNHKMRHSGFGLIKCLTDAALLAEVVDGRPGGGSVEYRSANPLTESEHHIDESRLRELNSRHLDTWLDAADRGAVGEAWGNELRSEFGEKGLHFTPYEVSVAMAHAHHRVGAGEAGEPFPLNREMLYDIKHA